MAGGKEKTIFRGDTEAASLEANHRPTDNPFWQESWYFNFSDLASGVWGLSRIGYRPARNTADGLLMAVVDGKPEVLYAPVGRRLDSSKVTIDSPRVVKTNALLYQCDEALSRWRIQAKTARLDFDVAFTAETPAHVFPSMDARQASAASDHYEQSGRVTGRLRIGGIERTLDGRGQRDHSWGPRDWSGVGEWIWLSGQFASGWCMNWWSVGEGAGSTITGFVGYPDRTVPANGGSVTWQGDPTGRYPTGARVVLELADGTRKVIQMNIHHHWPLYKDGATIMEFVCTYECDGEKGSGISEHLFKDAHALRTHLPRAPGFIWKALRTLW